MIIYVYFLKCEYEYLCNVPAAYCFFWSICASVIQLDLEYGESSTTFAHSMLLIDYKCKYLHFCYFITFCEFHFFVL